jgi:hypothetical protein
MLGRGGGGHESVEESSQIEKSAHGKSWTGQYFDRTEFGKGHPRRKQQLRAIRLADDQVESFTVLCFTNDEYRLTGERMIGVSDRYFECQTPSIMDSP